MNGYSRYVSRLLLMAIAIILVSACTVSHNNNRQKSTPAAGSNTIVRDGSSFEKAIIIKAGDEMSGVQAEYRWLAKHYPGYRMKMQSLLFNENKPYDLLDFITPDGREHKIYFDISSFYGKL